jgi:membrane protein
MKKKFSFKSVVPLLKKTFKGFSEDKVPKLSASLAYSTVFSLGPLLIVIISLCSIFFKQEAIEGTIYTQMRGFVGSSAANQIQEIVKNASISGKGTIAAIIGIVTLLIGATSVFAEIQDSINTIWGLKPKPKAGLMKLVKDRLLSFGVIGSLGFLLLVSLAVTAVIETIGNRLKAQFPDVTVVVFYIVNLILTLGVTSLLFAVIFKVLPDAKIRWKDVRAGALVTAVLFMLGKFGISFYISKSNIGTTFGTAGSLVVLLIWIYYSSIILYIGAEFTRAYAIDFGKAIHPNQYAVVVEKVEVEKGHESLQEAEKHQQTANPAQNNIKRKSAPPPAQSSPGKKQPGKIHGGKAVAVALLAFLVNSIRSGRS